MSATAHILEMSETLLRYREEEFLCDTAIITTDRQIKAHSVLLAAVSPVFRGAFASSGSSSGMYQVDLQNVESHVLETALDFVYTGQLIVPSPDYATPDKLGTLFSTLQDLGLDVNRLNGCEITFKSDKKKLMKGKTIKKAKPVEIKDVVEQIQNIKTEVEIDSDIPLKLSEYSLEDVTPMQANAELKWKSILSKKKPGKLEDSATENDLCAGDSDDTTEGVNGCDAAEEDEGENDEEGENCILVENHDDEAEGSKYFFMMVPNKNSVETADVSEKQRNAHPSATFECNACDESFPDKRNLMSHVKNTHLCEICGHAFIARADLEEHVQQRHPGLNRHSSKLVSTFHCTACGELFEGEDKINEHLASSPECASVEQASMQVTMLSGGDARRPYLCDTCGKNFSSALSLRMHTKLHTGERPFSCTTCGKSFVQKVQLIQHEQRHLGIRPYMCDLCDRSFSQKGQLTLHTRLHTGERPFVCEYCNASYVSRPLLTQHRRLHTGERPHVCATCSKNFAHKESLIVHMRTHTGEKPFECTLCGSRYTQSHHLKGHMRTHTGEKPFSCNLCEKAYKNRVDLRFHCTRVHGIDISKRKTKSLLIVGEEMEQVDSQ